MLSVHSQPTTAAKRALWRPGISSLSASRDTSTSDRSKLTPVSPDVTEVASTSSTHPAQDATAFRQQLTQSSTSCTSQLASEQPQHQPDAEATSADPLTCTLLNTSVYNKVNNYIVIRIRYERVNWKCRTDNLNRRTGHWWARKARCLMCRITV